MANVLMPLTGLCALLACAACSSDHDANMSAAAGASSAGSGGEASPSGGGQTSANTAAGSAGRGGGAASGGAVSGGSATSAGSAGRASAGESSGPPPAVDGQSIYALECHGDSKDCQLATVPCFGVSSPTPNVAAGWACANRCASNADCSDAPSGAEARASCVPFASAGHCVLVCRNENQSFSCPDGMACYVPTKSPIGYCLWQ